MKGYFSGPGQRAFRLDDELRLMPADEAGPDRQRNERDDADDDHHRAGDALDLMSQHVGGETEHAGPDERADAVGRQKLRPGHAVCPRQDAREAAQQRDEPGNDHDLAAVPEEQIFAELDAALGYPHVRPIAQQQAVAEFEANQITDELAHDRRDGGDDDHPADIQLVPGSGKNPRQDQDGLARKRQPDAFQPDDQGDHEQAVLADQMSNVVPQHA